ncbi:MAG: PEP-CTERM sorting domain-containing protein [Desulfuromonadales bacterium]|nr:PEP-CTERM sorting domain-containing protein [Desulfuromonadales bacterium]
MPGPTPTDYVLSGGQLCLDGAGSLVDCGDVAAVETINHNLGANQAVYALVSPELNDFIRSWDNSSAYDTLSLDIRLRDLNDGYEQIFIQTVTVIPEPSTLLLLGGGLVGLGFWSRRKDRK